MGTQQSKQEELNEVSNESFDTETLLQMKEQINSHQISCCFCNQEQLNETTTPWSYQTTTYLLNNFQKCSWSKYLLKMFQNQKQDYKLIQDYFINEIVHISQQVQRGFNIQQELKQVLKPNISDLSYKQNTQMINPMMDLSLPLSNVVQYPNLASSLLEDYPSPQKRAKSGIVDAHKYFYKRCMGIIEIHLKNSSNPLNLLLTGYFQYFQEFKIRKDGEKSSGLRELIIKSKLTSGDQIEKKSHSSLEDIKTFVSFFQISLYGFYNFDKILSSQQLNFFNKQNLSSFVLTLLFRDDQIFQHLFEGLQEQNREKTDQFYMNVKLFQDKRPSFFGVPQHLELISDSLKDLSVNRFEPKQLTASEFYQKGMSSTKQDIFCFDQKYQPYEDAIEQLRLLCKVRSPVHQLKLISKTIDLIQQSIDQFFSRNNQKQIINFGADELISILCYIIVQSQIRDLGIYLKMIEIFTPKQTLNSSAGYKLVTLQTCFYIITHYQEIEQKKEDFRQSDSMDQSRYSEMHLDEDRTSLNFV